MQTPQYNDAKQHLLAVANIVAPTGDVQRNFVTLLHNMEDNSFERKEIITRLTAAIHEGLVHGKWPE